MRALLRLVRLPLIPTAVADPWAGWFLAGGAIEARPLVLLAVFSVCAYAFGMVFNDLCDLPGDRTEHPARPLPSGTVSRRWAGALALALLGGAALAAWHLPPATRHVACALLASIAGYDAFLKVWPPAGAAGMGLCRALNFLTGALAADVGTISMSTASGAAVLGLYVCAITTISSRERLAPHLAPWVRRGLLMLIPLDAALCLAGTWDIAATALILSLLGVRLVLGRVLPVN